MDGWVGGWMDRWIKGWTGKHNNYGPTRRRRDVNAGTGVDADSIFSAIFAEV